MEKKLKQEPGPCRKCGRTPVVVKVRAGCYRVACPYLDCIQVNSFGTTENDAIENWNKEAAKK